MDRQAMASFADELEKIAVALADRTLGSLGSGLGSALRNAGSGLLSGTKSLWTGARKGSEAMAQHFESSGSRGGKLLATASRLAPYAGAVYLGDKVLNSTPVQAVRQRLSGAGQGAYYQ